MPLSDQLARCMAARALQADITTFCVAYQMGAFRCADELFSFATIFGKFNHSKVTETDKAEDCESVDGENDDADEGYCNAKVYDEKEDSFYNLFVNKMSTEKDLKKISSFIDALRVCLYAEYHFVYALRQVYIIAVAVPISSAFEERLFSGSQEFAQQWCKIVLNHYL